MINSITGETFAASTNLGHCIAAFYEAIDKSRHQDTIVKAKLFETLRHGISDISRVATDLDLDATYASAEECLDLQGRAKRTPEGNYCLSCADTERLTWMLQNLRMNFCSQMSSKIILVLQTKHSHYMAEDISFFGHDVEDAFPAASEDIAEAAKCLALQRYTAVVFHLMRAMESAIQKLAGHLGVSCAEKVWGHLLSDISKAIEKMPKGPKRDAWSQNHALLYHVKQAWRNDTMHPKATYTEDQAESVFAAVKSFMDHLALLVSSEE